MKLKLSFTLKTIFSSLILLITTFCAQSNVTFQKIYESSVGLSLTRPYQTPDHGYILCGTIEDSLNSFNRNLVLMKTDSLGVLQWSYAYGPSSYLEISDKLTPSFHYKLTPLS